MRRDREGHGPVRYGPGLPGLGLPVPPELAAVAARALPLAHPVPPGGGPELLAAACGYWSRRGLATDPRHVAGAPGAPPLLHAISAAVGGDVLLPRPCTAWWTPQATLLGGAVYPVATAAEGGGVPDPYALLETVRRVRAEGGNPRLLVLSAADDPTGTVAPPDLLHATVQAAVAQGLRIISDETWRDTLHRRPGGPDPDAGGHPASGLGAVPGSRPGPPAPPGPAARPEPPVLVSPAVMAPDHVTVVTDLAGAHLPPSWPAAVARFPGTDEGRRLAGRALDVLTALGGVLAAPVAAAATHALTEPAGWAAHRAAANRLHAELARALHRTVVTAGAVARPPQAGRHLYADLGPLRPALTALGVGDAQELEDFLSGRLGMPAPGGHRFGDDLAALRVRLSTGPLLTGAATAADASADTVADADRYGLAALAARHALGLPRVAAALERAAAVFDDLRADTQRLEPR